MFGLGTYGAWVVFDLRLAAFLLSLSIGISLLIIGLSARRSRHWHQNLTLFVSLVSVFCLVGFILLQTVFHYPVFVLRDIFPID